jgi:hypothetical protein
VNLDTSTVFFAITQIFTAASVYAAIRADMREFQVRITMLEKQIDKPFYSRQQKA